jgi:tetratricopeptide (TPR) repeat protein
VSLEALDRLPASDQTSERCIALHTAGQIFYFVGSYLRAKALFEESLKVARQLGDLEMVGSSLHRLGIACWGAKDIPSAKIYLEDALSFTRLNGTHREIGVALIALAQLYRTQHEFPQALILYLEAIEVVRPHGDHYCMAVALINAVMTEVDLGDVDQAIEHLGQVVAIAESINSLAITQSVLDSAAGLAARMALWEPAVELYGLAEEFCRETACARDPADSEFLMPKMEQARAFLGPHEFRRVLESRNLFSRAKVFEELTRWSAELNRRALTCSVTTLHSDQ